jgi:hypothetical protein
MIVVNPNEVVGLDDLVQLIGKMLIDLGVAGQVLPRELGEVETVMQDRP